MKTTTSFLPAILFGVFLTTTHAQSNFGEFRWGLKGGVNFASVYKISEEIEIDKNRVGFAGGAFCKIPLSPKMSIRPELLFSMKGATLDIPSDVDGVFDRVKFRSSWAELPLSLDFDLPFFLDLHAGVQGALALSKKPDAENYKSAEFGWHAGTGIDLGNIGIHVRFQQSLVSFYEASFYGAGKVEPKNWGISLTASYMFVN
jgi:Outer membrane protein beta-barrel domain